MGFGDLETPNPKSQTPYPIPQVGMHARCADKMRMGLIVESSLVSNRKD